MFEYRFRNHCGPRSSTRRSSRGQIWLWFLTCSTCVGGQRHARRSAAWLTLRHQFRDRPISGDSPLASGYVIDPVNCRNACAIRPRGRFAGQNPEVVAVYRPLTSPARREVRLLLVTDRGAKQQLSVSAGTACDPRTFIGIVAVTAKRARDDNSKAVCSVSINVDLDDEAEPRASARAR